MNRKKEVMIGMYRGWYKKHLRYYKKMGASEETN